MHSEGGILICAMVTPFMRRVINNLKEARKTIFVDMICSSAHPGRRVPARPTIHPYLDPEGGEVITVPMLCGSPVGTVPVGVVFTNQCDEAVFIRGTAFNWGVWGSTYRYLVWRDS